MAFLKPVRLLKYAITHHPSKEFLDEYFGADTSKFSFRFDMLEPSEIEAGNLLVGFLKPKILIRLPEVDNPENIRTPDFIIDGIRYEIKAPTSLDQIKKRIREGKVQVGQNGFIVMSTYNCRNQEERFLRRVTNEAKYFKIEELYYVSKNGVELIKIKK